MRVRAVNVLLATIAGALSIAASAQEEEVLRTIQLDDVVIHAQDTGFNVEGFVHHVMEDTTFHKAFLNTRFHPHHLRSVLRVRAKHEKETANIYRTGDLVRNGDKVHLELDTVHETGKLRDRKGKFRYLTAEMYDDVFFIKGELPADNIVAHRALEVERGSRFDKYKSELKKFMFDPGTEIASVPFIGDKLALFSPEMTPLYDFKIGSDVRNGHACWVFSASAKPEFRDGRTVIKTMDTWFAQEGGEVLSRRYRIAHSSMVLDFDISIRVENQLIEGELVPRTVDYDGDWDIPLKQRELVRFVLEYSGWRVVK